MITGTLTFDVGIAVSDEEDLTELSKKIIKTVNSIVEVSSCEEVDSDVEDDDDDDDE